MRLDYMECFVFENTVETIGCQYFSLASRDGYKHHIDCNGTEEIFESYGNVYINQESDYMKCIL